MDAEKVNFQMKSLEGMYGVYGFILEGYLQKTASSDAADPFSKTIWHTVRMVDAHGVIVFYECTDDEWFYFKARFREGRLIDLFGLKV